jgi:membrane protein DedA with SNARE-associated domain/rhodanese-related sulfurtransferase
MAFLIDLIAQYGLLVVFINVLAEQGGAPLPAYPMMLLAGAFLERSDYSWNQLLATIVFASLLADMLWFEAGRRYGNRILRLLCRISLSPDSCVRQTESIYTRWGSQSLLVAKFIPGFASIASALAGVVGTSRFKFLIFDGLGAALWGGSAVTLGYLFRTTLNDLLDVLENLGKVGLGLILLALVAFLAAKWWQRQRFIKELRMAQISVPELYDLMAKGSEPSVVVLDVRTEESRKRTGYIPGSKLVSTDQLDAQLEDISKDAEIILYCACPNEASAARVAKMLIQRGYHRVRPLKGGIDGWVSAGFLVEGR